MSAKKTKANPKQLGGTIVLRLDECKKVFDTFNVVHCKFPSCTISFTTQGINNPEFISLKWSVNSMRDFSHAYDFFANYHLNYPISAMSKEDFAFKCCHPIQLDFLKSMRLESSLMQENGRFKDCVFFYSISSDFSHGYVHFYAHEFNDLLSFQEYYEKSNYSYN